MGRRFKIDKDRVGQRGKAAEKKDKFVLNRTQKSILISENWYWTIAPSPVFGIQGFGAVQNRFLSPVGSKDDHGGETGIRLLRSCVRSSFATHTSWSCLP